ncbi:hypothetical protein [Alteromonas sp. CYL-A6]|uniref:hypothetical protein n=1 Tax=Alteromonas nitratireducens TaxID=3390813 RepID=UPI0034BB1621
MRTWLFLVVLGVVFTVTTPLLPAQTLKFAAIDYCPFSCIPEMENGKEGFMIEVLREAFPPPSYTLRFDFLPYARAVELVRGGLYDGIVVVGKDYAPDLIYPDKPTVLQRVIFLTKISFDWRYTGPGSLTDLQLGVVKGYHYVDADLVDYIAINQYDSTKIRIIHGDATTHRGLQLLLSGRVNAFIEGEYSAMYEVKKHQFDNRIAIAGFTKNAFEDYSAFSPALANAENLAVTLDQEILRMQINGKLRLIMASYGVKAEQNIFN